MAAHKFNVYVGTELGLLKGVNTENRYFHNINSLEEAKRDNEITTMCWGDTDQNEICLGLKSQTVRIYDRKKKCFTNTLNVQSGDGPLRGLAKYNSNFVTCVESGAVVLWDSADKEQIKIDAGKDLCRMRQNPVKPNIIATGGKENDLKIWDLEQFEMPVFKAKNVRNDFLDLRVPVWVTDMQFIPDSEKIVVSTGYHHVRVYDPSTPQRRPVMNMEFDEYPLTSLSLTHSDNQVVVGNTRGRLALIDLRKKSMVHVYKGFAGSVRCVQCHPTLPLVASVSLDRFLRIHDLHTHLLLSKIYLKSQLNCLLVCDEYNLHEEVPEAKMDTDSEEHDLESEEIWEDMEVVGKTLKSDKKKKRKITQDKSHVDAEKLNRNDYVSGSDGEAVMDTRLKKKKLKKKTT